MTDKRTDGFDPVHAEMHGYARKDWDEVSDNPEWTEEDFAKAKPFAEVFPGLAESLRRDRDHPARQEKRQEVRLRLDADVVAKFKATGKGWQSRINEVLKNAKL
ncbi:hypothetical protein GCM10011390_40080 [Aureimonas endophytica]|uniref:BrnA antitoxin of type II toxin-antitoxin system n=1 Tax=Aureimonas endophytica TaxID=2027858 RepID=A0A917E9C0_9HYPH|nr:BrnA antitoxin family protein [Aureimonas endophytica]GGE16964.1 hypothetical protein GCM10011390_40080 [Aureimonas endophytica]